MCSFREKTFCPVGGQLCHPVQLRPAKCESFSLDSFTKVFRLSATKWGRPYGVMYICVVVLVVQDPPPPLIPRFYALGRGPL